MFWWSCPGRWRCPDRSQRSWWRCSALSGRALVTCAAVYAAVPGLYKEENKSADVTQFRQSLTDNEIPVSLLIQVGKKHSVSYTVPVHAGRSYIYMLTFTSWPYFFTAGRSSISFRQLSPSTEPTDGGIYRGHRGRMEIRVDVKGISCHGSAPEPMAMIFSPWPIQPMTLPRPSISTLS
mgnify:CR=1 FL=1